MPNGANGVRNVSYSPLQSISRSPPVLATRMSRPAPPKARSSYDGFGFGTTLLPPLKSRSSLTLR